MFSGQQKKRILSSETKKIRIHPAEVFTSAKGIKKSFADGKQICIITVLSIV
jgi:hypothetical protein